MVQFGVETRGTQLLLMADYIILSSWLPSLWRFSLQGPYRGRAVRSTPSPTQPRNGGAATPLVSTSMGGGCVAEGAKDLLVSHPDSCIPMGPSTELETLQSTPLRAPSPKLPHLCCPQGPGAPTSVDHSLPSLSRCSGPGLLLWSLLF